jgi:hypothetical protein
MHSDLIRHQRPNMTNTNARAAAGAPFHHGYVDGVVLSAARQQLPQSSGAVVAECGTFAAGEDRCHLACVRRHQRTNQIDAAMQPSHPPCSDAMIHEIEAHACA